MSLKMNFKNWQTIEQSKIDKINLKKPLWLSKLKNLILNLSEIH